MSIWGWIKNSENPTVPKATPAKQDVQGNWTGGLLEHYWGQDDSSAHNLLQIH